VSAKRVRILITSSVLLTFAVLNRSSFHVLGNVVTPNMQKHSLLVGLTEYLRASPRSHRTGPYRRLRSAFASTTDTLEVHNATYKTICNKSTPTYAESGRLEFRFKHGSASSENAVFVDLVARIVKASINANICQHPLSSPVLREMYVAPKERLHRNESTNAGRKCSTSCWSGCVRMVNK
jgi:hypothetical protein